MKKMLSMMLCVALVLTLGVVAFAADGVAELGNNTYNYVAGSDIYLEFTAEEAGNYTITNNTTADGAYLAVPSYCVTEGQYYCYGNGQQIFFTLEADETIEINLWSNKGADIAYDFDIELTSAAGGDEPEKETNEVPQIGENYMLIENEVDGVYVLETTFTAPNAATYIFTMDDSDGFLEDSENPYYYEKKVALEAGEVYAFIINSWTEYASFSIEEQVIEGELNEVPQVGPNNILAEPNSWGSMYLTFVAAEGGLYKITNTHEEGDETYFYSYYFSQSNVYAGESTFFELDEGDDIEFTVYPKDATVKFTIEKVDPATVEPDGSSMFPFVVTDGDAIDIEMEASEYVYYTFTPTADGVLTLTGEVTDANIYVDNLMRTAEDTWVMNVTEGEVVEIKLAGGYSWYEEVNPYVYLEVAFEAGEHQANGSYDYPLTLTKGELNQFVANDGNYIYYFFTTDADGVLTISGDLQGASLLLDGAVVDEDGNYVRNVRAGSELEIRIYLSSSAEDSVELELTVAFDEGVLEPNGTEEFPYELPMGEFNVSLVTYGKIYYTFTAPADGLLLIDSNLPEDITSESNVYFTGMKNHATPDMFYLNMKEGDVLFLTVSPYTTYDMTAVVTFTEGEEYHNGSSSDPFILEEGETEIVLTESNSGEGYYYTFTATEAGVYTIVLPEKIEVYAHPFTMSEDGRTGTVELEAGETIEFNLWADKIAVDGVFTFGIDDGNDGPVVDPDPIVPAGDYTFLVFAMMVVSMAAIVVLVSKKRNF